MRQRASGAWCGGLTLVLSLTAWLALVACSSSSSIPASSREQARSYARGNVPCVTDSDCCVVIDRCINQALVVRSTDKDKVAALVSQPDPAGCTGCLLPAVQVACVSGQCVGTLVNEFSSDAGVDAAVYMSLTTDHCGSIAGVSAKNVPLSDLRAEAILGCGPQ